MGKCDVCGNDYHLSFEVTATGQTYAFDHGIRGVADHV
jgi:hypothetical protein